MWSKKFVVPAVALLIIAGALIRRGHPGVGHWTVVAAMGYFLFAKLREIAVEFRSFRRLPGAKKAAVGAYILLVAALVAESDVTGEVHYFYMVALLALDYLIFPMQNDE